MYTRFLFTAIVLTFVVAAPGILRAQSPEHLSLPADGSKIFSAPTDAGIRYRITVEGTYSMWPQFKDCHGVDAVYVYDVPQAEYDAFRWPPKSLVPIPHWVGDPTEWGYDIIRLSFRRHKGFRIDNEPLPNTGFNATSHRYQVEKMGTGRPFTFQVLDSNYNILDEKVIPRYEDNCGSLKLTVERITPTPEINICDIEAICKDGRVVGLKLWAGIFEVDSTQPGGKRNSLKSISPQQIAIVDNGYVRCDIDSISCAAPAGQIAVGLVVDRSESMGAPISTSDQTERMTASKQAITHFVDNMRTGDSAFVLSFSTDIRLDQNWTADHQKLKTAIATLQPDSKTAFYKAVLAGLEKAATSSAPRRALIVLSDGYKHRHDTVERHDAGCRPHAEHPGLHPGARAAQRRSGQAGAHEDGIDRRGFRRKVLRGPSGIDAGFDLSEDRRVPDQRGLLRHLFSHIGLHTGHAEIPPHHLCAVRHRDHDESDQLCLSHLFPGFRRGYSGRA